MYSIPGYDPCNFYDFTESYTFKYMLKCHPTNSRGEVLALGHKEGVKYEYENVVRYPNLNPYIMTYEYAVSNSQTRFRVLDPNITLDLAFDFRDWKYLSQIERFHSVIADNETIGGYKNGSITIDFNRMSSRDKNNGTKFLVAGRMFWETHVFNQPKGIRSHSTNGFFDLEGYVEPKRSLDTA